MGIPGVLKEIGRGERIALAKLAVEHLERTQRPLRIAIDAAIWNFQTQAGQGGKNPALRTLYYRLLRLLALPIHPLFVYDGKNKPLSKRGQTVSRYGSCLANETSRKLIEQFRFPCHSAPGEAEAECAQLHRHGIVDMVMSQDGDAIMFGSGMTLRNWSKEGARGNKEPTHVDVLDLRKIKDGSRLDPEGMILVALLSGGDYNQQGLPGFGVHIACDIARAGFGADLLEAVRNDDNDAVRDWRERLEYELETNESGYFKKRHKTLKVPETFPDRKILGYYTNPAVSSADSLKKLEPHWSSEWGASIDVKSLRSYAGDTFDWQYKPGAFKLIRTLARPLLANRLQNGLADSLVKSASQIHERREHSTMGGIPELRVSAAPVDIVGLDLDVEDDSPEFLAMLEAEKDADNEMDDIENADDVPSASQSPSKTKKTAWNPYQHERMWIPETMVELGVPALLEEWNQAQRDKAELRRAKTVRKSKAAKPVKDADRIDRYFGVSRSQREAESQKHVLMDSATEVLNTSERMTTIPKKAPKEPLRRALSETSPDLKQYFKPVRRSGVFAQSTIKSGKHPLASPSPSPSRDISASSQTVMDSSLGTATDPVVLPSSPVNAIDNLIAAGPPQTPVRKTGGGRVDASPPVRDLENTVTQRTTRRVRKKLERAKTEGAMPSDSIDSFEDAILSSQAARPVVEDRFAAGKSPIPIDLGTGLKTDFRRRKVLAVPRDSLEGTWKEIEEGVITSKTDRRPRVSCVDLASD